MEYSESTKIVFQRIQKHDPENVSKLMGYLLFKDYGELQIIRLALGPEYVILALIEKLKHELGLTPKSASSAHASTSQASRPLSSLSTKFTPFMPAASRSSAPAAAPASLPVLANNAQRIPQISNAKLLMPSVPYYPALAYVNPAALGYSYFQNQPQFMPLEDQLGSLNLSGSYGHGKSYSPEVVKTQMSDQRVALHSSATCPKISEFNMQICENFKKGYCKYGGDCRYLHVIQTDNGYHMVLNPPTTHEKLRSNPSLPHGSVNELELDFIDLLKSRRGIPFTILSLPIMYFDRYEKVLQLEPYLAEARMQGQLNGGLSEFLSQMSKSFCVINRPHGMQSIILEDDIPRYFRFVEEKILEDPTGTCSHQIYMTFPPQSEFNETDVHNYFSLFGSVQEIRIPIQEKRMYGFVTFVYPETPVLVLSKSNPHVICGFQVLVKPYQHKRTSLHDRKTEEKAESQHQHATHTNSFLPSAAKPHSLSVSQPCMKIPSSVKEESIEENEPKIDYKMKSVCSADIATPSSHACTSPGQTSGSSTFLEGDLSGCSSSYEAKFNPFNDTDPQSYDGLNLPDNPFSF